MADANLRDLERRAALGDVDARAQFLRAQVQSGELTALEVRLLAFRQDPAALALVDAAGSGQDRAELASQVATRRAALSEGERTALDQAFYRAFLRATGGGRGPLPPEGEPGALTEMRELLVRGAATGAFEDYELGPDNFGTTVNDWLSGARRPSDADMAEAFGICIEAGPAFVTNRAYVGNGGLPAIWFVFEWFAESVDSARAPYVQGLLEAMCAAAEPRSPFWEHFVRAFVDMFLWRLDRAGEPLGERQGRVARFALELALDPPDVATGLASWIGPHNDCVPTAGRALIGLADPGLFDIVFELASAKAGVFGAASTVSLETAESLLTGALRDGPARRTLRTLIGRSPWLRDQAFERPALVFSLIRRRERKVLAALLSADVERMRALRDDAGNDLLLAACATRGRTEKLVALLLGRRFDPRLRNDAGEDALDLATRARNKTLIALLSTR